MYYKRLQKYGKKLVAAILTSALILASGATVYAEDTGEYLAQENIQETESVTDTSELAEAEADKSEIQKWIRRQKKRSCRSGNAERYKNAGCFRRTVRI